MNEVDITALSQCFAVLIWRQMNKALPASGVVPLPTFEVTEEDIALIKDHFVAMEHCESRESYVFTLLPPDGLDAFTKDRRNVPVEERLRVIEKPDEPVVIFRGPRRE